MERDAELHGKVDTIVEIVTGDGKPEDGLVLKVDRAQRLAETTSENLASLTETVTDLSAAVTNGFEKFGGDCVGRARDIHKRIDAGRTEVAREDEKTRTACEHDTRVLTQQIAATTEKVKSADSWIRGAFWVGAPVASIILALVGWALKLVFERLGHILQHIPPAP